MSAAWYALRTIGRQEASVASQLRQRGLEAFLPTKIERRAWSDRIRRVEAPLFPGYLFVRALLTPRNLLQIHRTRGALEIVGSRRDYAPTIDEAVISSLRKLVKGERELSVLATLPPGADVLIARGPLAGVRGRVDAHHKGYIVVDVNILNRSVRCPLDPENVVRTSDAALHIPL